MSARPSSASTARWQRSEHESSRLCSGPPEARSDGIIRWNGVGIAATVGTPVKAVETGTVRLVGQFGTYGLTVVVEHGNGYYSVYSHLEAAGVKLGNTVSKGGVIGKVGGENSDYGPHLHFEIRGENQIALDPATWLRRR